MSRITVVLLVVLCAAIAGLIVFSKLRSGPGQQAGGSQPVEMATSPGKNSAPTSRNAANNTRNIGARQIETANQPTVVAPANQFNNTSRTTVAAAANPGITTAQPLVIKPVGEPRDTGI